MAVDEFAEVVRDEVGVGEQDEAVLAEASLADELRKVLEAEGVEGGADGGELLELEFEHRAGEDVEGARDGERAVGDEDGDLGDGLAVVEVSLGEAGQLADGLHEVGRAEGAFAEEIHEPLGHGAR